MGIEGGHVIQNDLRLLRDFYRLGVRYDPMVWATIIADFSGDLDDKREAS